jgi:hypothetical protein
MTKKTSLITLTTIVNVLKLFLFVILTLRANEVESLSLVSLYHLVFEQLEPMQVEHLEGTPFGHALDLLTHIALYTNTLAYFSEASVRKKKSFKRFKPGQFNVSCNLD